MNIYDVPEDRRYWVVRADSGTYYDHFIRYGIVALGHLDDLNLKESRDTPYQPDLVSLETALKRMHETKEIKTRRALAHFNQVRSFISEMNIGDWVLTIGDASIQFGRITGTPRLDKTPLPIVYDAEKGKEVALEFNLRRKVSWGPKIKRNILPFGLLQSFRANQTLFNIDYHWDAIYHSLYPVFKRENNLYLSANINTKERVKNFSITSLLSLLNEIEVIAKEFDNIKNTEDFKRIFKQYIKYDDITITTKAEFHSPGEIWNRISDFIPGSKGIALVVLAYSMIFGNHELGFDGLVDLETRQKFWDIFIDRIKENNIEDTVKDLDLTVPRANTQKLESNANDEIV